MWWQTRLPAVLQSSLTKGWFPASLNGHTERKQEQIKERAFVRLKNINSSPNLSFFLISYPNYCHLGLILCFLLLLLLFSVGFTFWLLFLKFIYIIQLCWFENWHLYFSYCLYSKTHAYDPTSINQFIFQDRSVVSIILLKCYTWHAVIIPCPYIL